MRGDHAVAVLGRCGRAGAAALVGLVHGRALLVGGVPGSVEAELVHAVLAVAAGRVAGRGEAPVAVVGLVHPVLDLALHEERVVAAPRPRAPRLLGHEQRHHQRLEHAPAPGRHDLHPAVGQRTLEDPDAVVLLPGPDRLGLRPRPVAVVVREGAERAVVVLGRDLARGDAEVRRHPRLGVERTVVVAGVVDVRAPVAVVVGDRAAGRAARPRTRRGSGRRGPRPRCSRSRSPSTCGAGRPGRRATARHGRRAAGRWPARRCRRWTGTAGRCCRPRARPAASRAWRGRTSCRTCPTARGAPAGRSTRSWWPSAGSPRPDRSPRCRGRRRCSTGRRRCWWATCTRSAWPGRGHRRCCRPAARSPAPSSRPSTARCPRCTSSGPRA